MSSSRRQRAMMRSAKAVAVLADYLAMWDVYELGMWAPPAEIDLIVFCNKETRRIYDHHRPRHRR